MRERRSLTLGLALLLWCVACGQAAPGSIDAAAEAMTATRFMQPHDLPAVELVDQTGQRRSLRTTAAGKITFLYFGYTSCPDICPVTMARLDRGLEMLEPEERAQVEVLFVTLDPARDDPEAVRAWLGAMDSTFVGFTGTQAEVDSVLAGMGYVMPPPEGPREGAYEVAHPATLFLFTPELLGRFGYPFDAIQPETIASDVRELLAVDW